jgi:aromatic ring-opening dioxygenase catalytic subunit (LigB family)
MNRALLFFCLIAVTNVVIAQNQNFSLEYKQHYGFTIAHRQTMLHYYEKHYFLTDVSYIKNTSQKNDWQESYGFPKYGYTAVFTNFGKSKILGEAFGLMGFLQFENIEKKICFSFKIGGGFGYILNPFNREKNYKNIAVGSSLNGLMRLETSIKLNLNDKLCLSSGIAITHFSNASTKTPNLGINIATVQAGIKYTFENNKDSKKRNNADSLTNKPKFYATLQAGYKEVYPANGPVYGLGAASFAYFFNQNKKGQIGFGTDFFYSPSLREELQKDKNPNNNKNSIPQITINVNYEFTFGNFALPLILGVYVLDNVKKNGPIYQSIGLRYTANKHLVFSSILKSHLGKAEYNLWGIGWRW